MEEYELQTQNKFGKLLERERELARAIEGLEYALRENDTYKALVKLQEERDHLFDEFKAERLKEFQKRKIKTVSGVYGKITMTERTNFKVVDETAVPEQYKSMAVNMDLIAGLPTDTPESLFAEQRGSRNREEDYLWYASYS